MTWTKRDSSSDGRARFAALSRESVMTFFRKAILAALLLSGTLSSQAMSRGTVIDKSEIIPVTNPRQPE